MNVRTVDVSGAITGASVVAVETRMPADASQAHPTSSGNGAVSQQEIKQVVAKMQEQIDSMNISLQYSTYGANDEKIAITVVNKETGELIREIPPKELRSLYVKMSELAGMVFNREV